jgi:hypothetical protein
MKEALDLVRYVTFEKQVSNALINLMPAKDCKRTVTISSNHKSGHFIGQQILCCSWCNGNSEEKKSRCQNNVSGTYFNSLAE